LIYFTRTSILRLTLIPQHVQLNGSPRQLPNCRAAHHGEQVSIAQPAPALQSTKSSLEKQSTTPVDMAFLSKLRWPASRLLSCQSKFFT
jgi:hypothetical protein